MEDEEKWEEVKRRVQGVKGGEEEYFGRVQKGKKGMKRGLKEVGLEGYKASLIIFCRPHDRGALSDCQGMTGN